MIKVYCDTGGYRSELKDLHQKGLIQVIQFHYENRNNNIKNSAPPSNPTWDEMNYSWNELSDLIWDDLGKTSDKHVEISRIIGKDNKRDIKHLDSAYMARCNAFITSDKDDICSNKNEIYHSL